MPTDENAINEQVMLDKLICSLNLNYKRDPRNRQRQLKEDNNNTGAEQSLTKDVRLEQRPEKPAIKKPLSKKKSRKSRLEPWLVLRRLLAFPTEALQR